MMWQRRTALPLWLLAAALVGGEADAAIQARHLETLARAQALMRSGDVEASLPVFEEANDLSHGRCPECHLGLALGALRQKRFKDAADHAKKAKKLAAKGPPLAQAQYFLGSALMGLDDGNGKKLREALPELRAAAEMDATQPSYRFQLGVALLRHGDDVAGIEELERYLEADPDSPNASTARAYIDHPPSAQATYAPAFSFVAESGRTITRDGLRGRVVLIDFWATWCPPCVESVPELKRLNERYPADRFVLLSVSLDSDEEAWRSFIADNDMRWEHTWDSRGEIVRGFLPERFAIPCYVVIDPDGVVREVTVGEGRRTVMRLRRAIEKALE